MRRVCLAFAPVLLFTMASAAQASDLIEASCDSVTDNDTAGCLYSGNINENPDPTNENGYNHAEEHYNVWAASTGNPAIDLVWLTATDAANFSDFGSITGAGGTSGTFDLSGYDIDFFAVKYGNEFTLYEYLGTDGTGTWATNSQNGMSHIAFFGTPNGVPEPGTWGMMLLGFGGVGYAMRRRRKQSGEIQQLA